MLLWVARLESSSTGCISGKWVQVRQLWAREEDLRQVQVPLQAWTWDPAPVYRRKISVQISPGQCFSKSCPQTSGISIIQWRIRNANPLCSKEIKPVNPKINQPWISTGRTDAEAEAPILWPPDAKSQLTGKDPDAGKDWGQEGEGMIEDGMTGWHHQLKGMSKLWEMVKDKEAWCTTFHGVTKRWTGLTHWTTVLP